MNSLECACEYAHSVYSSQRYIAFEYIKCSSLILFSANVHRAQYVSTCVSSIVYYLVAHFLLS